MLFKLTMFLGILSFSLVSCTQPTPNAVTVEVTREVTRQMGGKGMHITTPMMQLQDTKQTKVLIVTLAETTPVLEAASLQSDLRRAGIEPWAWIINTSVAAASVKSPLLRQRAANVLDFSMGGIGAGCICLNGIGGLQDFALHHHPQLSALPDQWTPSESAFALLQHRTYDLIITDIILPGISGIELLAKYRKQNPSQKVIVITAYASLTTAVEAIKAGACDFIIKPLMHDEMKKVVRNALDK